MDTIARFSRLASPAAQEFAPTEAYEMLHALMPNHQSNMVHSQAESEG